MRAIAPASEPLYRNLLMSLVENSQLAAMEVADCVDMDRIPHLLDSLRLSAARTARTLEYLLAHSSRIPRKTGPGKKP